MGHFQTAPPDAHREPRNRATGLAGIAVLAVLLLLPAGGHVLGPTVHPAPVNSRSITMAASPGAGWVADRAPASLSSISPVRQFVLRDLPTLPAGPTELGAGPRHVSLSSGPGPLGRSAPLAPSVPAALALGPGFSGIDSSQCYCAPPDVIDAAGPTQIVEMVNLEMQVWTKQGVSVHAAGVSTFFGAGNDFLSDPRVLYDNQSGRWIASIFDSGPAGTGLIRVAISSTSDAAGTWTLFSGVTAPSGEFPDQPILGVSDNLVAFGGNMFSETTSAFFGSEYWVVDKAALLNGSSAAVESWGPDPNYLSIHPVQSLGSTSTQYFVSSTSAYATVIAVWAVTGVPPYSTVARSNLSVAAYLGAPAGRAPGGGLIDSADTRIQTALWQSGDLWMAFDDQCTPSGDIAARACVRVVEANVAGPAVVQDFDYGLTGLDLYYPAMALDGAGDLAMSFGVSSGTLYPSGGVTGQAATDARGTMQAYRTVVAGSASQNCGGPCRYGDYFGAAPDPTSPIDWVAVEYLAPYAMWNSWIAPVRIAGPMSAAMTSTPAGADAGIPVTLTVTTANVSCSTLLDLYCAGTIPLGDGTTVTAACAATAGGFSWSHAYASPGIYSVGLAGFLTLYRSPGCTAGSEVANVSITPLSLTVAPTPQVQLFASPANGADVGQPVAFQVAVAGGQPPFAYAWSALPTGCIDSGTAWLNCTVLQAETTALTVQVTDANGVSRSRSLDFTVSPALSTTLAIAHTLVDAGQSLSFVATPAGGSGVYTISWAGLPPGCYDVNESSFACTPTVAGLYAVNETTSDTNGVSVVSDTIGLQVADALQVGLAPIPSGEAGRSAALLASASGGVPPYSFNWSGLPSGCTSSNSARLTCTPGAAGSYSVQVTVVDAAGFASDATATWSVNTAGSSLGTVDATTLLEIVAATVVVLVLIGVVLWRRRPRSPARASRAPPSG